MGELDLEFPLVSLVFHPTDFSEGSDNAFAHALAIAIARKADITLFHVEDRDPNHDSWLHFPPVRTTLEQWGLLEPGSPRSAVFDQLTIGVKKIKLPGGDPLDVVMDYLELNPVDLIVLATEGREGLQRWLRPSFAERLTRRSKTKTLFVPDNARGFVSLQDGALTLKRILIPVDGEPSPQPAIVYAARAAELMGTQPVEIILFHVGVAMDIPHLAPPETSACHWQTVTRQGQVAEEIIRAAREYRADLIAMTTQGRHGFIDALRGSVSEQVLRHSPCPVLAVPI
jgi:nucleotide-binding universal stress UspA family protein